MTTSTLPLIAALTRYTDPTAKDFGELVFWKGKALCEPIVLQWPKTEDQLWPVLIAGRFYYLSDDTQASIFSEFDPATESRKQVSAEEVFELIKSE